MSGLEEVLLDHQRVRDHYSALCACGKWRDKRDDGTRHRVHVADAIRAHLRAVAKDEGVRDKCEREVSAARLTWRGGPDESYDELIADAALTAFLDALEASP